MLALLRQLLAARTPTSRLPLRHGGHETSARSVAIRPAMRPRRPWGVVFLGSLLVLVLPEGCGGGAEPPASGDGGSDAGALCTPRLPAAWVPQWRPPRALRSACSEGQIQHEYMACESATATSSSCAQFRNDPSNAICIECLFSAADEPSYGAIIRVDKSWRSNTAGCIALVDGDNSASGCGARVQAASACNDVACTGCEPFTSYAQCRDEATHTACRQYYLDSVCLLRPDYSTCTAYATNQDYFVAAARLFCGIAKEPSAVRRRRGAP